MTASTWSLWSGTVAAVAAVLAVGLLVTSEVGRARGRRRAAAVDGLSVVLGAVVLAVACLRPVLG